MTKPVNCACCDSEAEKLFKGVYGDGYRCPNPKCLTKVLGGGCWYPLKLWNSAQEIITEFRMKDFERGYCSYPKENY